MHVALTAAKGDLGAGSCAHGTSPRRRP